MSLDRSLQERNCLFSFRFLFFFLFRFPFPNASFDSPSKRELAAFVTRNIFFFHAYKMYIYILCVLQARISLFIARACERTNKRTHVELVLSNDRVLRKTRIFFFTFSPSFPLSFSSCLLFFNFSFS